MDSPGSVCNSATLAYALVMSRAQMEGAEGLVCPVRVQCACTRAAVCSEFGKGTLGEQHFRASAVKALRRRFWLPSSSLCFKCF